MIVVMKNGKIYTFKDGLQAYTFDHKDNSNRINIYEPKTKETTAIFFSTDVEAIFMRDADYLYSIGSDMVRNLK